MMMKNAKSIMQKSLIGAVLIIACLMVRFTSGFAQNSGINAIAKEVTFTLEDRDRMIRLEEKVIRLEERIAASEDKMDIKFIALNEKIDRLYTLIYFVLGGIISLIGFVLWDRRSYIKPVKDDLLELRNILKEFAKDQPKLSEILKTHGIL